MGQIEIKVRMKVKNMYEFMLRDAYLGIGGIGGILFSIAMMAYFFAAQETLTGGQRVIVILGALLFIVINPLLILFNSTKQVKLNPSFREELGYVLSEQGVLVQLNDQEALVKWDEFYKVVETGQSVILYITKKRAFILPKESIENQYEDIKKMVSNEVGEEKCKWKKR